MIQMTWKWWGWVLRMRPKEWRGFLGISRRLPKSAPPTSVPEQSKPAKRGEGEGFIRVPKRDLNWAQNILIDPVMGKKVRWASAGTRDEVSFSLPQVQPGETSCELCCQSFANTRSFKKYMRTHSGDTGYSCEDCGKVLASRVMLDLHLQSRGQEMQLHCIECGRGYTTKQALVAHLRARHGPPPALGELMYVLCAEKGFKVLKTMREPMASLKGPFPCLVDGCTAGPFSFLDTWLKSMDSLLAVSNGVAYYMCVLGLQWSLL